MVKVKVFIPKYDLQGDEVEVEDGLTEEEWKERKQTLIEDFIKNFSRTFKKRYGYDFDDFGKGRYKDNRDNRKLGRVGREYDKASALKDELRRQTRDLSMNVQNERAVLSGILPSRFKVPKKERFKRRRWTTQEEKFLRSQKKLTYRQIGMRLLRTPASVKSKARRLEIRRR